MAEESLKDRQIAALRIWAMIVAICILTIVIVNLAFMAQNGHFNNRWHNLPPPYYKLQVELYLEMDC